MVRRKTIQILDEEKLNGNIRYTVLVIASSEKGAKARVMSKVRAESPIGYYSPEIVGSKRTEEGVFIEDGSLFNEFVYQVKI